MSSRPPGQRFTFRNFAALFGLGLIGVLALLLTIHVDPAYAVQAAQLGVPLELLAMAAGVQSVFIIVVVYGPGKFSRGSIPGAADVGGESR